MQHHEPAPATFVPQHTHGHVYARLLWRLLPAYSSLALVNMQERMRLSFTKSETLCLAGCVVFVERVSPATRRTCASTAYARKWT